MRKPPTLRGIRHYTFQHGYETWLLWSNGRTHRVEKISGHWTAAELGLVVDEGEASK